MSDRYKWDESPQGQDFQGGAPLSPEGVRAADHYLLAQLGARVLEILGLTELPGNFVYPDKLKAIRAAARSLGLLDEKGGAS